MNGMAHRIDDGSGSWYIDGKVRCPNYHVWQSHEVTLPCMVMGMASVVFLIIFVLQRHELSNDTSVMALHGAQLGHRRSGARTTMVGIVVGL